MDTIFCSIGIDFSEEEQSIIAKAQIGPKIENVSNVDLTAVQYSAAGVEELRKILYKFIDHKISAYMEVKKVLENEQL